MWNKLIKSNWFYIAILLIVPLVIWGFILKSFFTKKEPYQYISVCVPHEIRCEGSDNFNCLSQSVFEGLVKDKGKCDYLKIPTIFKPRANRDDIEINLPLNVITPKLKVQSNLDKVEISRGSNLSMLYHIKDNAGEEPNTKIFGMDAYVRFYTEPWSDAFKRNTKGWENMTHYSFYATVVAKDKSAHLYCMESRLEKFDLNQINPRLLCNVSAVADDSLWFRYTIPYSVIGQFDEINKSYVRLLKSFKYEIKH